MHAYDLARLRGGTLVVRRARAGERLVTLDDVERPLTEDMVVIADGEGVIGLAGIMGGAGTEVSAESRDILLEAAYWTPARVPAHSPRPQLEHRGELPVRARRSTSGAAEAAMRRCIELVLATAGGELAEPPLDLWPEPSFAPRIFLRPARVAQVLGVELPWADLERHLVAIGATVVSKPEDGRIAVDVPGWRPDLQREIDLIEEIARLHGYDRFPADLRPFRTRESAGRAGGGGQRRAAPGTCGRGVLRGREPADGRGARAPTACGCSIRWRRTMRGSGAASCPAWSGWWRPTGPTRSADVRLFEIGTAFICRRPGGAAGGGAARGRGAHRPSRAGALDRHRRRAVRHLGSEGAARGRRRSGDSGSRRAG